MIQQPNLNAQFSGVCQFFDFDKEALDQVGYFVVDHCWEWLLLRLSIDLFIKNVFLSFKPLFRNCNDKLTCEMVADGSLSPLAVRVSKVFKS